MNKTTFATIAIALSSLAAGQAMAAKAPYLNESYFGPAAAAATTNKSRADVRAELTAAQRAGEIASTKNTESELPSFQRSAQSSVAGKSRAEVRAELAAANAAPAAVDVNVW
jgi:Cdc6-like AAA superfamily ATPase